MIEFLKHRAILLFMVFFVLSSSLTAQVFKGVVSNDMTGEPIGQVIVQLISANENKIIAFGQSNSEGFYELNLNDAVLIENKEPLILELRKIDFETLQHRFEYISTKSIYEQDLYITSKISLEPIIVKGTIKPFKEKKDTVTYNVAAYKDGSERVIEDVLKNMPGLEVNEISGLIKYKGVSIEKVLLEGDDLFDNNYTAGTKNISADIIKSVEAIENWSENELLHGIEDTQKVALNLKLKKNVLDYSGTARLGYGVVDRFENGIHGIGVSHRYKNFTTLSQNNIGLNNAPYNYFYSYISKDEQERMPFMSEKIIEEEKYYGALSHKVNQNELWYGNFNQIFKLHKKHDLRINASYLQDKLEQNKAVYTSYALDQENFKTSEEENIIKEPKLIDLNLKWTWKHSKNSMFSWETKWFDEKIDTDKLLLVNAANDVNTTLNSRNYFLKNELVFTKRLNSQNAYQLSGIYASNSAPQKLRITPGLDFERDEFLENAFNQQSVKTSKDKIHVEANYLGKLNKGNKYQLIAYIDYEQQKMSSWLTQLSQSNELDYNILDANINAFYNFNWSGFIIKPELATHFYDLKWKDLHANESKTLSKVVLNPKISIRKSISPASRISLISSINSNTQNLNRLYNNFIMNTDRTLKKNQVSIGFQESFFSALSFQHTSLYNQFETEWTASYHQQSNVYFNDNTIRYNFNEISFFQLPEKHKSINLGGMLEKYIPFLTSTARLKGNYTRMNFKNKINSGDLRDVLGQTVSLELFYKTAFDIPLNFENTLRTQYYQSRSDALQTYSNTSIINKTRLLFVPNKRLYAALTMEYYQPKTTGNDNIFFLDFDLNYKLQKPKLRLSLEARNLTDNKVFESIYINDYSQSRSTQNLVPRYILLGVDFGF